MKKNNPPDIQSELTPLVAQAMEITASLPSGLVDRLDVTITIEFDAPDAIAIIQRCIPGTNRARIDEVAARALYLWRLLQTDTRGLDRALADHPIDALTLLGVCSLEAEAALQTAQLLNESVKNAKETVDKTLHARHNANARHDKPGGSRDIQQQVRALWASGTYSGRNQCATQIEASLGIPYDTARKALRNTPDPDPWPAKPKKKGA